MKNRNLCSIPEIKQRTCFQLNKTLYKTKEAAAKKTSWSWILTKYAPKTGDTLNDVKRILDYECECSAERIYYDQNTGETVYPHEACELHDRKNGYFARLQRRVSLAIVSSWSKS